MDDNSVFRKPALKSAALALFSLIVAYCNYTLLTSVSERDVMTKNGKSKDIKAKPVTVTVSKAADFKGRQLATNRSLTLREYKELSAKDRLTLTPGEQKRLDEAHAQLRKIAESLTSQYDFSAITKLTQSYTMPPIAQQSIAKALAIDTSPMLKIVAEMQKTPLMSTQPALTQMIDLQKTVMPAIQAIYKSNVFTQHQFTALAAIQKSLITFPTDSLVTTIKGMQEAFQAPLIARTMFADFQTMHERILHNLTFDISSLKTSIEFSRFETVDVVVDEVTTNDKSLTATAIATQTNSVADITFTDRAGLQLILNKLDDNQREIAELRQQLLARDSQQGQQLITPSTVSFKRSTSSIQIGKFKVSVTISSRQAQFARTVLTSQDSIGKKWDIEDLILAAFGERIADDEQKWIEKIRSYIWQFNQKVMIASGGTMPNYLILENIYVFVNPDYL